MSPGEAMHRKRIWESRTWPERYAVALAELRRAMDIRGYPPGWRPRIRVFAYNKRGAPLYAVVLRNQGRERRRDIYVSATRWDILVQKLAFRQWSPLAHTRMARRWPGPAAAAVTELAGCVNCEQARRRSWLNHR